MFTEQFFIDLVFAIVMTIVLSQTFDYINGKK